MSFLNPGILWLLPLISIPLLIHLLGRQRFQTVEFSTLRFLKSLQSDVLRRLKIRQIILLIIRTLLILCLILIFARPYRSDQAPGIFVAKGSNLYLIIDNSASMNLNRQGRTQLEAGLELIRSGAKTIDFPITLHLIHATQSATIASRRTLSGLVDLEQVIARIPSTNYSSQLLPAIALAVEDIKKNQDPNAIIWLVSDFQRSNWSGRPPDEQKIREAIQENKIRLVLFPVRGDADNSALGAIHFTEQIQAKDKPINLQVTATNWRPRAYENSVALFIGEERVGQSLIDLPASKSAPATFEFVPLTTGMLNGYLQISDDDLPADNRRFFVLNIPATLRILVIGSKASDGNYIMKALQANPDQSISARFITTEYLGNEKLTNYDGLIFSEVVSLSKVNKNALNDYLQSGGGILLFVSRDCTPEQFNSLWAEGFDFPRWHSTRRTVDGTYLGIGQFSPDHPVFRELWPQNIIPAGAARFFNIPGLICGANQKILMSFDDGTPLIVEVQRDAGRALMVATVPQVDWTDLPFSGFFPVVLQRLAFYIAGSADQPLEYACGDTILITRMPGDNSIPQVQTPSGRRFTPQILTDQLSFEQTAEIGIYSLIQDGIPSKLFAVNLPPGETSGDFFNEADYHTMIKDNPANLAVASDIAAGEIRQLTLTRELSSILLIIAFCLALGETFIGRLNRTESKKQSPK